ncbi:phage tail protein [Pseudomonas sp. Q12-87]|uniref:phage tail protein n=1 Tax=Pseudomonas sp. Q12-87 TaxID=177989 RepID=UPI000B22E65C|nr:phage tail protein [Pseudomonas sp. Q12-87]
MTDQNTQFFAILTAIGKAKQANADALGIPWTFAQMAVGDANGTDPIPNEQQTHLINERRRAPLNQLKVDPANPNIIIAEQVIPENVGGWWIREVSLYDADGDMVAVANCAPSFKPLLSQGSGRTQVVRMNLIVSNTANVELKIDPSVVLATRQYVDSKILEELYKLDSKQSVRVATMANIALTGLQIVDGVTLLAGDRVLVKNQTAAKDNGIYVAGSAAWQRAPDADSNAEVTSAMILSVEQGATLADTRWQLVTDGSINVGTTALTFQNVTQGFAPLNSPALIGTPTAPTVAGTDNSTQIATSAAVRAIMAQFGLGADAAKIPLITDFSADIKPGLYRAFTKGHPEASIGGPPETSVSGGTSMTVVVAGGYVLPGYKTFLAIINSTANGPTRAYIGHKVTAGEVPVWNEIAQSLHLPYRTKFLYNAAGVFQWTVPANVWKVFVEVRGGGGSGAFGSLETGAGGGGAGGFSTRLVPVTPGTVITITVGAGGASVSAANTMGNPGGTSSFGPHCSATGGAGGLITGGAGGGYGSGGDFNGMLGSGNPPVRNSAGTGANGGAGGGGESIFAAVDTTLLTQPGMGGGGRVGTRSQAGADGCVFITC